MVEDLALPPQYSSGSMRQMDATDNKRKAASYPE